MANMSYCRFRNTDQDLFDCVNAMEEVNSIDDLELCSDEFSAFKRMARLCEKFLEESERLLENGEYHD